MTKKMRRFVRHEESVMRTIRVPFRLRSSAAGTSRAIAGLRAEEREERLTDANDWLAGWAKCETFDRAGFYDDMALLESMGVIGPCDCCDVALVDMFDAPELYPAPLTASLAAFARAA